MRALLCFLLAGLAPAFGADRLAGGPFVVNVGPRTATIVWVVQTDSLELQLKDGKTRTAPSLKVEKTTLTGLQPNTRYEFEAGGAEAGKGSFKTAPVEATPFRFVVFGDTRTRHDMHRKVVDAIVKRGIPDFVLHTGDLVSDGSDSGLWPVFFDIERQLLRSAAFYPALGNHERNSREFYDYFQVGPPYYSFNWGNVHFSVINSDLGNAASSTSAREAFWAEQTRWLDEDLGKNQKADFRFILAHHPPFTAVSTRDDNKNMTALVPLFEKHQVAAGFFGHDHNYQRHEKNGIQYIITGGGGAPLYDVGKPDPVITKKVMSTEHFVSISVDGKTAKVEVLALDGSPIENIELKAGQ
jgi:3',5'-cyclic AMP phosphodiesterase CpdA